MATSNASLAERIEAARRSRPGPRLYTTAADLVARTLNGAAKGRWQNVMRFEPVVSRRYEQGPQEAR